MPDRLTPLDATFLELEPEEIAHMHIGAALVFDPRPDGSVPTVEALRGEPRRPPRATAALPAQASPEPRGTED